MLEKLQEIIRRYTDDENIVINGGMILLTDLGLDSFDLMQIVNEVEATFDVEIPDRAVNDLKTVQNVLDFIAAHS